MNLAGWLESLREGALREIDKIDDGVLLSKDLDHLIDQVAERNYLEPPRLHRAVIGTPRAVSVKVPGEPGREPLHRRQEARADGPVGPGAVDGGGVEDDAPLAAPRP